jgi:hypothetical protein
VAHHVGGVGAEEISTFAGRVRTHDDEVGRDFARLLDDLVMDPALAHGDRHVARVEAALLRDDVERLLRGAPLLLVEIGRGRTSRGLPALSAAR